MEAWEKEVLAPHRWGRHGENRAREELERLRVLWDAAQPIDEGVRALIGQVFGPEICNWRLSETILLVCGAIGAKTPLPHGTGHAATMTESRWKRIWAYYFALSAWLHLTPRGGCEAALASCDLTGATERTVREMLGERDGLKELYVERVRLCLAVLLGARFPEDSGAAVSHTAAVVAVEEEIRRRDHEGGILNALREYREGEYLAYVGLEPCHHKLFRRLDIILSSIGAAEWRGAMPRRGTDGFERAEEVERHLAPIEAWLEGEEPVDELSKVAVSKLGTADPAKVFLASLLVSLLRAQALSARMRAECGGDRETGTS